MELSARDIRTSSKEQSHCFGLRKEAGNLLLEDFKFSNIETAHIERIFLSPSSLSPFTESGAPHIPLPVFLRPDSISPSYS